MAQLQVFEVEWVASVVFKRSHDLIAHPFNLSKINGHSIFKEKKKAT